MQALIQERQRVRDLEVSMKEAGTQLEEALQLQEVLTQREQACDLLKQMVEGLAKRVRELEQHMAEASESESQDFALAEATLQQIREELSNERNGNRHLEDKLREFEDSLKRAHHYRDALESQLVEKAQTIAHVETLREREKLLDASNRQLKEELREHIEFRDVLQWKHDSLQVKVKELESAKSDEETRRRSLESELARQVELLEKTQRDTSSQNEALKDELSQLQNAMKELENSRRDLQEFISAQQAALAEAQFREQELQQALENEKEQNSSYEMYNNALAVDLATSKSINEQNQQVREELLLQLQHAKKACDDFEERLDASHKALQRATGDLEQLEEMLLTSKNDVAELSQQLATKNAVISALEQELELVRATQRDSEEREQSVLANLTATQQREIILQDLLDQRDNEIALGHRSEEALKAQIELMRGELAQRSIEIEEFKRDKVRLINEKQKVEARAEAHSLEKMALQGRMTQALASLKKAEHAESSLKAQLEQELTHKQRLEESLSKTQGENRAAQIHTAALRHEIEKLQELLRASQEGMEQSEKQRQSLLEEHKTLQDKFDSQSIQFETTRLQAHDLSKSLHERQSQLGLVQQELALATTRSLAFQTELQGKEGELLQAQRRNEENEESYSKLFALKESLFEELQALKAHDKENNERLAVAEEHLTRKVKECAMLAQSVEEHKESLLEMRCALDDERAEAQAFADEKAQYMLQIQELNEHLRLQQLRHEVDQQQWETNCNRLKQALLGLNNQLRSLRELEETHTKLEELLALGAPVSSEPPRATSRTMETSPQRHQPQADDLFGVPGDTPSTPMSRTSLFA